MFANAAGHAALVAFALGGAGAIVWLLQRVAARFGRTATLLAAADPGTVFLFDGGALVDATPAARDILRLADRQGVDLDATVGILGARFPDLADRLARLERGAALRLGGTQARDSLVAERWDNLLRISLGPGRDGVDSVQLAALERELGDLRSIAEDAPQLIWKEDANGTVVWANRAYLAFVDSMADRDPEEPRPWPARPVFGTLPRPAGEGRAERHRVSATSAAGAPARPFEVTSVRRGDSTVHFATDASAEVAAETARKVFVQTLTKTFANLHTGLAIFDRQRRLVLFNPAFLDMTGLPTDFLSARPVVHSVLDRLRDMQMLPEPKNYASWRDQVAALEAAAENGSYCETWVLPAGQTYRVTGRPHPDGAIAFLFEDISDEISLTRHFRSGQETAQAVLDCMPQAVAVFSVAGTMTMCNSAYDRLWAREDSAQGLNDRALQDEIARWQAMTAPGPEWAAVAARFAPGAARQADRMPLLLSDGRAMVARFEPLPGGATLAEFREAARDDGLGLVPLPAAKPRRSRRAAASAPLRDTGT